MERWTKTVGVARGLAMVVVAVVLAACSGCRTRAGATFEGDAYPWLRGQDGRGGEPVGCGPAVSGRLCAEVSKKGGEAR